MANKSRKPARWIFRPVGMDAWSPTANQPEAGTVVVKVQPYGCPRNGTMGHCYVRSANDPDGSNCLVLLNSLEPA